MVNQQWIGQQWIGQQWMERRSMVQYFLGSLLKPLRQEHFLCRAAVWTASIALIAAATMFVSPAIADSTTGEPAADLANGAAVFQAHCEGCHLNGGNIIRRGKNLKLNALKRNGMDSLEAIAAIVTHGKNNMSAFRDRLTDQQIQDVAAYVLNRAEADWKKLPAA